MSELASGSVCGAGGLLQEQALQRIPSFVQQQARCDLDAVLALSGVAGRVHALGGGCEGTQARHELGRPFSGEGALATLRRLRGDERAQGGAAPRRRVADEALCNIREACVDDGVIRVNLQANAFQHGKAAQYVEEVGRDLKHVAVRLRQPREPASHVVDVNLGSATAGTEIRIDSGKDLRDTLAGNGALLALWHKPEAHEVSRDGVVLLACEVSHVLEEGDAQLRLHRGHQAPVEDAEAPVLGAEQVARVRVAVQRACLQEHEQVGGEAHGAQLADVAGRV
mmetsp:Transcript_6879/g.18650  ORF Transcript_6879/g.18650 Transcript_6879/m.18650 type:complete len:282 (+) Transcript_6879:767-1612(+)